MHPRDRELLLEYLNVADTEERRHVERIHILVTTAIIASYFTPVARELIKTENIGQYTEFLVGLSIVYLGLRLFDITLPIQEVNQRLATGFQIFSPVLFLFAVICYLFLVFLTVLGVTVSLPVAGAFAIVVINFISAVAFQSYRNGPILDRSTQRNTSSDSAVGRVISEVVLGEYVAEHPEEVEEGLTWDQGEWRSPGGVSIDVRGTDRHGSAVYGEIKHGAVTQDRVGPVLRLFGDVHDRKFLITNGNVTPRAKEELAEADIEIKHVDYNPENH
jgi:hypothetical protein